MTAHSQTLTLGVWAVLAGVILATPSDRAVAQDAKKEAKKRFNWAGLYSLSKKAGRRWRSLSKLSVSESGQLKIGKTAIAGLSIDKNGLSWPAEGNPYAGRLEFKDSDSGDEYWQGRDNVGPCLTGEITEKGQTTKVRGRLENPKYIAFSGQYTLQMKGPDGWGHEKTLEISPEGDVRYDGQSIRNPYFRFQRLQWHSEDGKSHGDLTFKAKDSDPKTWKDKGTVGASLTGWVALSLASKTTVRALKTGVVMTKDGQSLLGSRLTDFEARKKLGATKKTEEAIKKALDWLARHQNDDGSWYASGVSHRCTQKNACRGRGDYDGMDLYGLGVTGLALLAFLGHNDTHKTGDHKETVQKALDWLCKKQRKNGCFLDNENTTSNEIYNQATVTMALCEALALTQDGKLRQPAQRAINWCVKAQNPGLGWKYGVKPGRNDSSVTAWMTLALRTGEAAGVKVPSHALSDAVRWFVRASDSRGNVGYEVPGGGSSMNTKTKGRFEEVPCLTAASALVQTLLKKHTKPKRRDLKNKLKVITAKTPQWRNERRSTVHYYYWFFGSQVMTQNRGSKVKKWREALQSILLKNQSQDSCSKGSFPALGEWSPAGARVYSTAMATLTLEAPYRYKR